MEKNIICGGHIKVRAEETVVVRHPHFTDKETGSYQILTANLR